MRSPLPRHRPSRTVRILGLTAMACLAIVPVLAQTARLGGEFRVNSYTTGYQLNARVAVDATGKFVVVWESLDGNATGVAARRFSAAGAKLGDESIVNSYTTNFQASPDVSADGSGNFVVAWQSYRQDGSYDGVFSQRVSSAGSPQGGEFFVNTATLYDQLGPAVTRNATGSFIVVWEGPEGFQTTIYGQRYDAAGVAQGGEFEVAAFNQGYKGYPSIGLASSGDFVVVWEGSDQDGSGYGVFGQRFRPNGNKNGQEFQVNTYTTGSQSIPSVAVNASGTFVAAWQSPQDGSASGIIAQRYNSSGTKLGVEFQVNTNTTSEQRRASIGIDTAGNFVVVWQSILQDGSQYGVFGQRYLSTGAKKGVEFRVNTFTTGSQVHPSVRMNPTNSDFVVAWDSFQDGSFTGIFGQRFRWADCPALAVSGPFNQTTCEGGTAFFRVTPSGWGPFTYQWRKNGVPLSDGGNIVGSKTATLKIKLATAADAAAYSCVVNDYCLPPASFATPTASLTLIPGQSAGAVTGLVLQKLSGGTSLRLNWNNTTNAADYVVFEDAAPSGSFGSQVGVVSSGLVGLTLPMPAGDRYYLVAGRNATCGVGPQD